MRSGPDRARHVPHPPPRAGQRAGALRFHDVSRIADAVEVDGRVELAVESMVGGSREVLAADLVVYATGYRPSDPCALLGELADACVRDSAGRLRVERDHRVATRPEFTAGIYLQGATEHTHGLSSTLLSTIAVRAGEIAESVAASVLGVREPAAAGAARQVP